MENNPVLIAGGGIAGLAAALALAKSGQPCQLFEKTPVFQEVGAGLQLGPNAVRALQAIGAWESTAKLCVSPPEIHIRDGLTGQFLQRIPLGQSFVDRFGAPYRVILRADLHAGLLAAAMAIPEIRIALGLGVSAARNDGDLVRVHFSDGAERLAPALIAADGVRSGLRQALLPEAQIKLLPHVLHRSLFAPPPSAGDVALDCVNLWLFPQGHIVHYPVGHDRKLNVVAVTSGTTIADGWTTASAMADVLHFFAAACSGLQAVLAASGNWIKWPAAFVPFFGNWNQGRILLMGDAAHATVPYLAQGGAMALEDAATLARLLGKGWPLPEAFARLSAERQPRCLNIHKQSLFNAQVYHATGIKRLLRNNLLQATPASAFLQRLAWIYNG